MPDNQKITSEIEVKCPACKKMIKTKYTFKFRKDLCEYLQEAKKITVEDDALIYCNQCNSVSQVPLKTTITHK